MLSTLKLAAPALLLVALTPISPLCNELAPPTCHTLAWIFIPVAVFTLRLYPISLLALTGLLALQAQWGIAQFIVQHDFGFQLIGESILSPDLPAIAKFASGELKLLRAYGPYGHANIFGGAMVITIALTMTMRQPVWRRWILPIALLALILSFSRSAYLGALAILVLMRYKRIAHWVPLVLVIAVFIPLFLLRFTDGEDQAAAERFRGYAWAATIIKTEPIVKGVGLRRYEDALKNFLHIRGIHHNEWEIAPVHSTPLLLGAEFGLIPAAIFMCAVLFLVFLMPEKQLLFAAVLPALVFDHYFLTNIAAFALLGVALLAKPPQTKLSSI